jgi:molecular chaperone DnaK
MRPEERPRRTVQVHDVTAHGVGVIARARDTGEQVNSIVVPRNSPIPSQGKRRFRTLAENQREILLVVTEGDDTDLRYVTVVGSARLTIPPRTGAVDFDIEISYDADGMIHIALTDPDAPTDGGPIAEFDLDRQANLDAAEVRRMRQALRSLEVS